MTTWITCFSDEGQGRTETEAAALPATDILIRSYVATFGVSRENDWMSNNTPNVLSSWAKGPLFSNFWIHVDHPGHDRSANLNNQMFGRSPDVVRSLAGPYLWISIDRLYSTYRYLVPRTSERWVRIIFEEQWMRT